MSQVGTAVRELRWTDVPALGELEVAIFTADAWSGDSWWRELAGRPRRDYVAVDDEEGLVAYAGVDHGGEVADVMTLAVAPRGRGRALGRVLIEELERRARARGAAHVMLEVRADNAPALALYERAGYVVISTRRGYYQPGGIDALVMRKSLQESGGHHG